MMSMPTLSGIDHEAEAENVRWEHLCTVAAKLDVGELIERTMEEIRGESADTPLSRLIEDWLTEPLYDWDRPQVMPATCEALGRYVAGVAADIVRQRIEESVERSAEVPF